MWVNEWVSEYDNEARKDGGRNGGCVKSRQGRGGWQTCLTVLGIHHVLVMEGSSTAKMSAFLSICHHVE